MRLNENRGRLVGGLLVSEGDEVIAIKQSGQITRSLVADVPVKGRDTMGVKFVSVRGDDSVIAIALYPEAGVEAETEDDPSDAEEVIVGGDDYASAAEGADLTEEDRDE